MPRGAFWAITRGLQNFCPIPNFIRPPQSSTEEYMYMVSGQMRPCISIQIQSVHLYYQFCLPVSQSPFSQPQSAHFALCSSVALIIHLETRSFSHLAGQSFCKNSVGQSVITTLRWLEISSITHKIKTSRRCTLLSHLAALPFNDACSFILNTVHCALIVIKIKKQTCV